MQKLQSGRISRRIFISSALAAGLAIPAALSLSGQALAQVPKKGGAIKFGFGSGSTTDFLDPATYEGTIKTAVAYLFGNNLVELDANGNLVPELATEYSSNDAITWVFTLREGSSSTTTKPLPLPLSSPQSTTTVAKDRNLR